MSTKQDKSTERNSKNRSPAVGVNAPVSLPFSEIGICECGNPATVECSKGIAPEVWTEPKFCCDECWQNELPQIPD